jgi:hypothetical protein
MSNFKRSHMILIRVFVITFGLLCFAFTNEARIGSSISNTALEFQDTVGLQDTEAELIRELTENANARMPAMAVVIDEDCQRFLKKFIDDGAKRLARDGATPEQRSRALNNFNQFIDVLLKNGIRTRDRRLLLTGRAFGRAYWSLCPGFYPFC